MEYEIYAELRHINLTELSMFSLIEGSLSYVSENCIMKDQDLQYSMDQHYFNEEYMRKVESLVDLLSICYHKDETDTSLSRMSDNLCELLENHTITELFDLTTRDLLSKVVRLC